LGIHRAHYSQGKLVAPNGAGLADPRPSAANQGTIITVSLNPLHSSLVYVPDKIATLQAEDLFYDVPLRRKSFKSGADEYNRIIDVVTRYAVHNPHVAWVCKKVR
jgi:DNA mismatch repair protein MLH1